MANEPGGGGGPRGPNAGKELPQHPLVESLRPDPSQPAKKTVVLIGLPGKSDRPGYQRLYLTTKLDYYAEFLVSGILSAETIPADKSPFPGHEATRVTVGRDANIQYITATSPHPVDEFDLDVRLGAQASAAVPSSDHLTCATCAVTCARCVNTQCNQQTCNTCLTICVNTGCNQNTCVNTQCNQNTCVKTQCNQATCTCPTDCNQGPTCVATCDNTCNPHVHTCGPHCPLP
jgi:hypothetical protein